MFGKGIFEEKKKEKYVSFQFLGLLSYMYDVNRVECSNQFIYIFIKYYIIYKGKKMGENL